MGAGNPRIGLVALLVVGTALVAASGAARSGGEHQAVVLSRDVPLLIDYSGARDAHDIAQAENEFLKQPLSEVGPFPVPAAVWVRLDLPPAGRGTHDWQLLLEGSHYQFGTLYVRSSPLGYTPVYGAEVNGSGDDGLRRSVFNVPRGVSADDPVFLRVVAQGSPQLALTLWNNHAFNVDGTLTGLVDPTYGLLLVVAVTALISGLLWRQAALLELAGLSVALLSVLVFASGAAYSVDVLAWLSLHTQAAIAFSAVALLIALRYSLRVLRSESEAPVVARWATVPQCALAAIAVAALVLDVTYGAWLARIMAFIAYFVAAVACILALRAWRAGRREAVFLTFAWLWFTLFYGLRQLGLSGGGLLAAHGLHVAFGGSIVLLVVGYIDRAMGLRRTFALQVRNQQITGDLLRVERSRRDFADEVADLLRTVDPGQYEESILERFLDRLSTMLPFSGAAVAVSHRGDVRLVVHGDGSARNSFESILATREELLQSVCLSDRAAVIHSDDLGVDPARDGMGCLGIVPVKADRSEWAGVLLARSGELEFGIGELDLVGDFAHQAYGALRNAEQFGRVRRQAETDPLTGIFNRRALLARGLRSFRKARSLRLTLSVLFVDIDHFKSINDEWGHAVGDGALQAVATLCSESLRDNDFLGRYGGEEFLAVLPGAAAADAAHVAERLRAAVENNVITVEGSALKLTVSVGIAELSPAFADFDAMLRAADRALYRAKRDGRNRVVHHRYELRGTRVTRPLG